MAQPSINPGSAAALAQAQASNLIAHPLGTAQPQAPVVYVYNNGFGLPPRQIENRRGCTLCIYILHCVAYSKA